MKAFKTFENGLRLCEIKNVASYKRAHHVLMMFHDNKDDMPSMQIAQKNFRKAYKSGYRLFVMLEGERAVGTIGIRNIPDPVETSHDAMLNNLMVLPEKRHHGIGSLMLDTMEDIAKTEKARAICFYVDKHDPDIRAFYEKRGFTESKRNIVMGKMVL